MYFGMKNILQELQEIPMELLVLFAQKRIRVQILTIQLVLFPLNFHLEVLDIIYLPLILQIILFGDTQTLPLLIILR